MSLYARSLAGAWSSANSEGLLTSITGAGAGLGIPERNGALLAEKTINAKGGINGRPIKIFVEDDGSNPEIALSKGNDLI